MATVFWQLWLARPVVADQRLPWERPQPPERLSPGRVRRAFSGLLPTLGTPAQAAQSRGKPPAAVQANVPDPDRRRLIRMANSAIRNGPR